MQSEYDAVPRRKKSRTTTSRPDSGMSGYRSSGSNVSRRSASKIGLGSKHASPARKKKTKQRESSATMESFFSDLNVGKETAIR